MNRRRAAGLLALAAVLATREPAGGGVPLVDQNGAPMRWDLATAQPNVAGGKVTFFPHSASLRDQVAGQETPLQALRDAVREWEIGTTAIRFEEDATRAATGPNGMDRVNWIGWVQGGLDPLVLGVTTITRDGAAITDADVRLNDRDWPWDTFAPGRAGIVDIQGLVTHEWGHALGCDHVPLRASTMYARTQPGIIALRTIAPDDRALVGSSYPNAAFQSATGTVTGLVDIAGAANDRAIHVVAIPVVSGEPEASTLTRPDGTYRIEGLPAGVYRIVAAPCLPLQGSMNPFWTSGSTNFLPSALRTGAANPSGVQPVTVAAGQAVAAPAMNVADATAPFEPNDSMAQAAPMEMGDALSARFESGADEDWYSFTGAAGQKITVNVLSWGLGADADPAVRIADAAGVTVATQDDARPPGPPDSWFGRVEGQDLDVRIVGLALPKDGAYFLRLRNQASSPGRDGFYVLLVTPSSDAPSTALTTVSAAPARIDADGRQTSTIVVRPRRETGDDVGPGAMVSLVHTGGGAASAVADRGDGTYAASVTAPASPGSDRFTVVVATPQGTATLLDAASLVYLGPADTATSALTVTPRRVDAGVPAEASVSLVPRDALGEQLGAGRAVVFSLAAPPGASLLGTVDAGDGTYGDTVAGTAARGAGTVSAAVDGVALAAAARISFGFGLAEVLTDVAADVDAFIATDGLSSKAGKAFAKAGFDAAAALSELADGGPEAERHAVAAARRVLARIVKGRRRANLPLADPGTERDLSRAIREAAARAIAAAVPAGARDQRTVDAANARIAEGDGAFAADEFEQAASKWRRAYDGVRGLAPR